MKKLLRFTLSEEVVAIEYTGDNWVEIHDFVGTQNFHYSFGQLYIKTQLGNLTLVEKGMTIMRLNGDHYDILSNDSEVEVLQTPYTEEVEITEQEKGDE